MKCNNCGHEVKQTMKYCQYCGAQLDNGFDYVPLVEQAKQGDELAFTDLYNYFYPSMLKIAITHTQVNGNSNQSDAEDVLQNAMISAFKNIGSVEDPKAFPGWLSTIVKNSAINYMKPEWKKKTVSLSSLATEDKDGKELEYDPEDEVGTYQPDIILDNQTRQDILKDVMSHLSEEQRIVTVMYFYDEMTMKEIAEELGIEQSTVVGRLQTAKKNIKAEISDIQKKQDLKLYNISAIPFFMWLLGKARTETEKQVASTATKTVASLATKQVAEKVATTTTSNVASDVTATTATTTATTTAAVGTGVSVATKVAIGAAIAVSAVGGGYVGYKHFIDTDNTSKSAEVAKDNTKEDAKDDLKDALEEATTTINTDYLTDDTEVVGNRIIFHGVSVEVPDGWIAKTQNESEVIHYSATPVITLYRNSVDFNNDHVIIWNAEGGGYGYGDYMDKIENPVNDDVPNIKVGTYDCEGNYGNVHAGTTPPEDELGVGGSSWGESYYSFTFYLNEGLFVPSFTINYIDHGTGSLTDGDLTQILSSFQLNTVGTYTLIDEAMGQSGVTAYKFALNTEEVETAQEEQVGFYQAGTYKVFEVYETSEGYQCYRVGMSSWIIDKGNGGVYTPDNN